MSSEEVTRKLDLKLLFSPFACRNLTGQQTAQKAEPCRTAETQRGFKKMSLLCMLGFLFFFKAGYDLFRGARLCGGKWCRYHSALLFTAMFATTTGSTWLNPTHDINQGGWLVIESELFHVSFCLHTLTSWWGFSLNRASQGFRLTHG